MSYPGQKMTSAHPGDTFFSLGRATYTTRIKAALFVLLWVVCFHGVDPARADGGGPQPTNTTLPGAQIAPTSLPGGQSAPTLLMGTPEVKSFEIIIDPNQNATVQPVTPDSQAALSRAEALEAQANTPPKEEEFTSPLWVFGFFTIMIIILMLNAVARGLRNRA